MVGPEGQPVGWAVAAAVEGSDDMFVICVSVCVNMEVVFDYLLFDWRLCKKMVGRCSEGLMRSESTQIKNNSNCVAVTRTMIMNTKNILERTKTTKNK